VNGEDFQITVRNNAHTLERRHRERLGSDELIMAAPASRDDLGAAAAPTTADPGTDVEIDVMVLYSPGARDNYGSNGEAAIEAEVQALVDYANIAFVNSDVAVRYRLVYSGLFVGNIDFNDPFNRSPSLALLREAYGADLVARILSFSEWQHEAIADGIACGLNVVFVPSRFCGYQEMLQNSGGLTYAHENGHLLGMNHDPANATGVSRIPWAYGHEVPGVFGTIMSYSALTIPYFSNPDITYQGHPMGIAGERDNAAVARENGPLIAAFRPAAPFLSPSESPTGLNFHVSNNGVGPQVQGGWFPLVEPDAWATAYDVQRSLDGVNFVNVGTVSATNTFVDASVTSPNTYYYRVRGTNIRGVGPYSAARVVVMPLVPNGVPTGLVATAQGTADIRLTWNDTVTNEAGYAVEIFMLNPETLTNEWLPLSVTGSGATSAVLSYPALFQPSTAYTFRVRGYVGDLSSGDAYLSAPSNTATVTTLSTNPGVVTGFAFNDPNRNGKPDLGETPAAGLIIFHDANGNGLLDSGVDRSVTVTSAVRNAPGTSLPYVSTPNYRLTGLPIGSRRICGGFKPTAPGSSCRTVTMTSGADAIVSFPILDKTVGVATVTPAAQSTAANRLVYFDVGWTHTEGRWVLLNNAVIRFADEDGEAIRIKFDEALRQFSVWDDRGGAFGAGVPAGQKTKLKGRDAQLYLETTEVRGTGPTGPSVVLRLALEFDAVTRGRTFSVAIQLEDDRGYLQGFDQLGVVTVTR
jgi:hypothetical protein